MMIICIPTSHRGRLFNTIIHPQRLSHVTLQPGSASGNVFISSCDDGILLFFDIRSSVNGILLLPAKYIFDPKLRLYLLLKHLVLAALLFQFRYLKPPKTTTKRFGPLHFPQWMRWLLPFIAQKQRSCLTSVKTLSGTDLYMFITWIRMFITLNWLKRSMSLYLQKFTFH